MSVRGAGQHVPSTNQLQGSEPSAGFGQRRKARHMPRAGFMMIMMTRGGDDGAEDVHDVYEAEAEEQVLEV